ncbi:hypothetical protein D1614_22865 [Maribellus luteus]|uniref:Uncharacterized protein n=1 Tax=Maribellus luteus TaxID=2305463 RepID=A0A399STQ2_9BACT|nr:hypothetical protein [Maribellus luteus]RIJ45513.1 hypothetical protein D1614_22865 [Maribellus luteus]
MSNPVSTIDYPIKYLKYFFLEDGYLEYRRNFIQYCAEKKKSNPELVQVEMTEFEIIISEPERIETKEVTLVTTSFSKNLIRDLKQQIDKSINFLRDVQFVNRQDIESFMHVQRVILQDIKDANNEIFENFPECKSLVDNLDKYIEGLTPTKKRVTNRIVKKVYEDDELIRYSLFAGRDVIASFLKWLHGKLIEHYIIVELDDSEEGERQFVEIYASSNPKELEYSVKFLKNNINAVLVINKMVEFLKNLTPKNIDESKCFVNKRGKTLNANDINVANNKIREEKIIGDNDVQKFIHEFEEKVSSLPENPKP